MTNLIKKDLKLLFNIKRQLIILIGCLLIFFVFSNMFQDYMAEQRLLNKVNVGIVDAEDSTLSNMLVQHFESNKEFSSLFTIQTGTEEELMLAFHNNELSAVVHIPATFTDSLLHFKNTPLDITLNANFPLQNLVLENIMESYSTYIKAVDVSIYSLYTTLKDEGLERSELTDINEKFSVNMVVTALNRNKVFLHSPLETFPSASSSHYFVFAIILLLVIFMASSGASLLGDELKTYNLQRYILTGNQLLPFILSKVLVMYLNMCTLMVPILGLLKVSNEQLKIIDLIYIFMFLSISMIFFILLALTVGTLLQNKNLNLLFSTLMTLILGLIGGNFMPIQIMPTFIQDLAAFVPNYWMLRGCLYLNNQTITNELKWISLSLIVGIFIFAQLEHILLKRAIQWEK